jgi:putative heme-binding domain-containing protein
VGHDVGPDLAALADKPADYFLVAILDPNRAVEPRYISYLVDLKSGRQLTGMLASETGTSITLVGPDGKARTVLRSRVERLVSTGKSLMPEGLEKDLSPRDLADLIAWLRSARKPKSFPGNRPALVKPDSEGVLKLLASNAEVYGPSLVLEKQYGNLGYWTSADDRAVWQVEVPRAGKYVVWLEYACDPGAAGNAFALEAGEAKVTGKVAGTGRWDVYKRARVGVLALGPGRQQVVMRAAGPLKGALIDLKGIELVPAR